MIFDGTLVPQILPDLRRGNSGAGPKFKTSRWPRLLFTTLFKLFKLLFLILLLAGDIK